MVNERYANWRNLTSFAKNVQMNYSWGTAVELNAAADSWHLANLVVDIINDPESKSSIANIQVWIERNSVSLWAYSFWHANLWECDLLTTL